MAGKLCTTKFISLRTVRNKLLFRLNINENSRTRLLQIAIHSIHGVFKERPFEIELAEMFVSTICIMIQDKQTKR